MKLTLIAIATALTATVNSTPLKRTDAASSRVSSYVSESGDDFNVPGANGSKAGGVSSTSLNDLDSDFSKDTQKTISQPKRQSQVLDIKPNLISQSYGDQDEAPNNVKVQGSKKTENSKQRPAPATTGWEKTENPNIELKQHMQDGHQVVDLNFFEEEHDAHSHGGNTMSSIAEQREHEAPKNDEQKSARVEAPKIEEPKPAQGKTSNVDEPKPDQSNASKINEPKPENVEPLKTNESNTAQDEAPQSAPPSEKLSDTSDQGQQPNGSDGASGNNQDNTQDENNSQDSAPEGGDDQESAIEDEYDQEPAQEDESLNRSSKLKKTTTGGKDLSKALREVLDYHNEVRALHGVPELKWDKELEQRAQTHIIKAKCGNLKHTVKVQGQKVFGENLATASTPLHGATLWYNEILLIEDSANFYNAAFKPDGKLGHFTQMIWADTTGVGCAIKACESGNPYSRNTYLVCEYSKPGNVIGARGKMNPPKGDFKRLLPGNYKSGQKKPSQKKPSQKKPSQKKPDQKKPTKSAH